MKITSVKHFFSEFTFLLIDFLFPPSKSEKELRNSSIKTFEKLLISDSKLFKKIPGPKIYFCFSYKNSLIKELVWQIKFRGQKQYAEICGYFLYKQILDIIKNSIDKNPRFATGQQQSILIPIPIHKKRRTERGFNQCEWLCEFIKKYDDKNTLEYDSLVLVRDKYQTKQSWKKRNERMNDLKNVFSVTNPDKIKNKVIFLIDDVYTTGSTLKEARRTLLESGAKSVHSIVIAH
jgi:ComF family protein